MRMLLCSLPTSSSVDALMGILVGSDRIYVAPLHWRMIAPHLSPELKAAVQVVEELAGIGIARWSFLDSLWFGGRDFTRLAIIAQPDVIRFIRGTLSPLISNPSAVVFPHDKFTSVSLQTHQFGYSIVEDSCLRNQHPDCIQYQPSAPLSQQDLCCAMYATSAKHRLRTPAPDI